MNVIPLSFLRLARGDQHCTTRATSAIIIGKLTSRMVVTRCGMMFCSALHSETTPTRLRHFLGSARALNASHRICKLECSLIVLH